jgi:hypothetical protein
MRRVMRRQAAFRSRSLEQGGEGNGNLFFGGQKFDRTVANAAHYAFVLLEPAIRAPIAT